MEAGGRRRWAGGGNGFGGWRSPIMEILVFVYDFFFVGISNGDFVDDDDDDD